MNAFVLSELCAERRRLGRPYFEFLRVPALSAGVYVLPAGGTDAQKPHNEDEVYYVVSGRGSVRVGDEDRAAGPGDVIYVPAGVAHHFHSIAEELMLLVLFAPAESP